MQQILITGGAGFIGSHLADELISKGYHVKVLDNLSPQVHGHSAVKPEYLNSSAEFIQGDVRDKVIVLRALRGVDAVFHFAACVGVGQSMYEIEKYTSTNDVGTAVLLESIIENPIKRLVVASSMSVYGEGLYAASDGRILLAARRSPDQLKAGDWEVQDSKAHAAQPLPTPESKPCDISSIYALNKYNQELMCLMVGQAYNIPTVALRFFNVYGTRQALSNPYTGVLAIFISRLMNGNAPLVYEDGEQKRDFVSVYDVARACRLALETDAAAQRVFNIGSGESVSIKDVAHAVASAMGKTEIKPQITGKYRVGDIRNCFADITLARTVLGFEPKVQFEDGVAELAHWVKGQNATDYVELAATQLHKRRLVV
jgi:dTDP-L-rhamnose 4-epimerase